MEDRAFDGLVRAFVTGGTRRRILGLLASLPLAGLLSGSDVSEARPGRKAQRHHARHQHRHAQTQRREDDRDDAHSDACIPTGQRCPGKKVRGKHARKLTCAHCCQGASHTEADGKQYCGCQPTGGNCTAESAASCCSGFCDGTTCRIPPSAPCERTCATTCCSAQCCPDPAAICHPTTGACCVPEDSADTCAGTCGTVTNNCGQSVTCPACPPSITSFTASPTTIDRGASETATLSWTTSNATTCSIDNGVGSVSCSGSTAVGPSATTIYTLGASGAGGGPVTDQTTVTVQYCHAITGQSGSCPSGATEVCLDHAIAATSSADAQAACETCAGATCGTASGPVGGSLWLRSGVGFFFYTNASGAACPPHIPQAGDITDFGTCFVSRWAP